VTLLPPAAVDEVRFDSDGVSARVSTDGAAREIRARFLFDARARVDVAASRMSGRPPRPGLGKLALFAHFRGAQGWPGRDEGTSRIFVFEDGWFWWIPFAGDLTSVGCVLHARAARECAGAPDEVFDAMIRRCRRVRDGLDKAVRLTEVHSAANISPRVERAVGDRFLWVGGAPALADPIFSSGAYASMRLAELAAGEILHAFRDDCFEASRFAGHVGRFDGWRSLFGPLDSVTGALAGGAFAHAPLRMWLSLQWFFAIVRVNRWRRPHRHRPVESRLPW
jgi:flavin-dependent dehydrogenase